MVMDVEQCVMQKTSCTKAAPLHQIVSSGPMDLVCIDFLFMEPDLKGISNVLVMLSMPRHFLQGTKNLSL